MKPSAIHRLVSPAVVLIGDIDTFGSGIVLNRDGLILTNHHVVASGLGLEVKAKVKDDGAVKAKTYEDVEVWKVHPEYDLALIKLDDPDVTFAPVRRRDEGGTLETGSACYAIGNPGGLEGALEHTITEGIVSAASRTIDELEYIQTSAALNPGSSGGALTDSRGRVVGVATLRLDQADNIGFAIPLAEVEVDDFIEPAERKPDRELAIACEKEAHRWADRSLRLEGEDREFALHMAAAFYRKCLEAVPDHPAPYNNLGTMYFRMKADESARRYLEKALEIDPDHASALSMLGIIIERNGGDGREATRLWMRGATDGADGRSKAGASDCAENLAISYIKDGNFPGAAYCVRWADSLAEAGPKRASVRRQIWRRSAGNLSETRFAFLRGKTAGFSEEGLREFLETGDGGGSPAEAMPDLLGATDQREEYLEIARSKLDEAVKIPKEGLEKPLPGVPGEIVTGYAGTCLLMEFPDLKRLGVFDLCQGKFVKYLPFDHPGACFAAGGDTLLIYDPEEHRAEIWDMTSWTLREEKDIRSELVFSALGMGLLNDRFALGIRPEGRHGTHERIALISIPDGRVAVPDFVKSRGGLALNHLFGHLDDNARVHVEESGTAALVAGAGRGFLRLSGVDSVSAHYIHGGGRRGSRVVTGGSEVVIGGRMEVFAATSEDGMLASTDERFNGRIRRAAVSSVAGARSVLEFAEIGERGPRMRLRSLPGLAVEFSSPVDEKLFRSIRGSRHRGRSVFASAYVQRAAFVDRDGKTITLLRMDREADAGSFGNAVPGARFTRRMSFPEGTRVKLESGPEGLKYDAENGSIDWRIPEDQERGTEVSVIFHLTDSEGEESFHIEEIFIP